VVLILVNNNKLHSPEQQKLQIGFPNKVTPYLTPFCFFWDSQFPPDPTAISTITEPVFITFTFLRWTSLGGLFSPSPKASGNHQGQHIFDFIFDSFFLSQKSADNFSGICLLQLSTSSATTSTVRNLPPSDLTCSFVSGRTSVTFDKIAQALGSSYGLQSCHSGFQNQNFLAGVNRTWGVIKSGKILPKVIRVLEWLIWYPARLAFCRTQCIHLFELGKFRGATASMEWKLILLCNKGIDAIPERYKAYKNWKCKLRPHLCQLPLPESPSIDFQNHINCQWLPT